MNYHHDDNLEEWENVLKGILLDPFTNFLDENQFRIDLFDITDAYIIEVFTKELELEEIEIMKCDHQLEIGIKCTQETEKRKRTIPFPFSLNDHPMHANHKGDLIEILIKKETCHKELHPAMIKMIG
ncbi:hypothetical protein WAK64_12905 [Bacillus spongiae]|uniref:Hsp20/alpha crystallin family protein n=1 Tax=Bacillus spongiae TaxID=2683610 RepID=A0ABU8HFB0_9BACI